MPHTFETHGASNPSSVMTKIDLHQRFGSDEANDLTAIGSTEVETTPTASKTLLATETDVNGAVLTAQHVTLGKDWLPGIFMKLQIRLKVKDQTFQMDYGTRFRHNRHHHYIHGFEARWLEGQTKFRHGICQHRRHAVTGLIETSRVVGSCRHRCNFDRGCVSDCHR